MLIRKLEMLNFRQFKGKNEIDFSTDINKNVTVIMGDNGAGKTTLAQAFIWCLYGSNDFKKKELINRDVRDAMMPGDMIEVKVTLWVRANEKENMLVRKQVYRRNNSRVEVKEENFAVAEKNEKTSEWVFNKPNASEVIIKNMLPKELSRFFFFDGERMDAMSKELEEGKSKEFASAVQGLVGLTSLKNAINHFKPTSSTSVIGKINEDIRKNSNGHMADLMLKINEANALIESNKTEIDEIEKQMKYYLELSAKIQHEILEMSSQIQLKKEYDAKQKLGADLREKRKVALNQMLKYFSQYTCFYLSMPLVQDSLNELKSANKIDKGIPRLHADTIKFLLDRKKCLCGQTLEIGDEHFDEVHKLFDVALPKSLGQAIGEYVSKEKNSASMAETYSSTFKMYISNIREIGNKIQELEKETADIYALLTDTSKARTLQQQKDIADKKYKELRDRSNLLVGKSANAEKDRKYYEAQKDKQQLLEEQNKKNSMLLAYATYIYERMDEEYSAKEKKVRIDLETEINNIFQNIYDDGIKISVDDKYNMKVSVTDVTSSNDELEKNTAQNYAVIFAFISGIISLAKRNQAEINQLFERESDESFDGYPLVMDAPLSAFDKTRIKNICETIPGIAQQVIIFIKDTDGEVAEEYMSSKIGKQYLINAISQTQTEIETR